MVSTMFSRTTNNADALYDQPLLRHRVEDHLTRLRIGAETVALDDHLRYRYENDLYNLLYLMGYPRSAFYAIMRINGMTHPGQFLSEREHLLIPNHDQLRWLHDVHSLYQRYSQ